MLRRIGIVTVVLNLVILSCALPPQTPPVSYPKKKTEPVIRVGLTEGREPLEFTMAGTCRIISHDGTFIARDIIGSRWRAELVSESVGQTVYRLVAASMSTMERAKIKSEELRKLGFDNFILPVGATLRIGDKIVNDNRTFRICLNKGFPSDEKAHRYQESIRKRLETFVIRHEKGDGAGKIILKNLQNGQQFEASKPVYIKGGPVTLYDIPVGRGFHWENTEIRSYPETITFQINNRGEMAVINIVPLETYLRGVVPSEMPEGFPLEALKAQAVAARGEALAKYGIVHRNDPYDICADVHCQVYSGLAKKSPETDRAVRETAGQVMFKSGKICNAVYSSVCGGHTENNGATWGGKQEPYLRGRVDGPNRLKWYGPLTIERNAKRWIDAQPSAFCNAKQNRTLPGLEYTKKYFRWEKELTQNEIRTSIARYAGESIGEIVDLIPVKRGVSGRISQLNVVGTKEKLTIDKELNIRKALSSTTLWSSCFYARKNGGSGRAPSSFLIKGAGFGHGVGMCQTGAAVMALTGKKYDAILKHYYSGVQIRRLY